jgi:hypothetical protein
VEPFEEPLKVAALMAGFERPWLVAGGWAIDIFLGCATRTHKDLEIAILREDQNNLRRHLTGWEFRKIIPRPSGELTQPWNEGEWLELPIHEIHAQRAGGNPSSIEILLNESSGEKWKFRRNPEIARPLTMIGLYSDIGVPFLRPEIVLLYKAKNPRIQDEDDFNSVRGLLDEGCRSWLRQAIEACYPGHAWLKALR